MRKLIFLVVLLFCFEVLAEELESPLRTRIRNLITRVAGEAWSTRLLGPLPVPVQEISLPEIPKVVKKSTDIDSYEKKTKEETEFDKLPPNQKRQFDFKFLQELFQVTRKTEPKDEDLSNWMNTLDQGGSREGIYQALVLDEVYAALENIQEKPTDRLKQFMLSTSQKYLAQTFKPETLSELNLYSLKRILTEKGLDLLEYFETKDLEALYKWYAMYSADLATQYGTLLKGSVRGDSSAKYHYEWAKQMPLQHIKSEFIIKTHMVMNGLQLIQ